MMTAILFLLVLAVLIFVHELGHFLVARACGIRVDAFALGFGPKLFSKTVGETTYSLNLIPFGGYVKIFGENPDDESMNGEDKTRSFVHKPKWQQIAVLFAGIFFNFVFLGRCVSDNLNLSCDVLCAVYLDVFTNVYHLYYAVAEF